MEGESKHYCCHCGHQITHTMRCRGCKAMFCPECMETHIVDNWRFIGHLYPEHETPAWWIESQKGGWRGNLI